MSSYVIDVEQEMMKNETNTKDTHLHRGDSVSKVRHIQKMVKQPS